MPMLRKPFVVLTFLQQLTKLKDLKKMEKLKQICSNPLLKDTHFLLVGALLCGELSRLYLCFMKLIVCVLGHADNLGGINEPCPSHSEARVSIHEVSLRELGSKGCGGCVLSVHPCCSGQI